MAKLEWTKDGDQRVARGKLAEYRVTEWRYTRGDHEYVLDVLMHATGERTNGGSYSTLQRAKDVAYSLDIR